MSMKSPAVAPGPALATVLAPISWGTTYVTITELLPDGRFESSMLFPVVLGDGRPLFVAWMRVAPAGLVLVTLGLLVSRWRPRGREWGRTAVLATCNFGLFFPLLFVAVYRLPGGVAAAVGGVQPLLVLGLTGLTTGRRPRPRDLAVGVVAAVGVGLVVVRPGADIDPIGVLAAVGANLSFSMGVVLTKRFPAPGNRLAATGWQLLAGATLLTPVALLVEGPPPPITGQNALGFAYLSLAGTAVAYVLWFRGIRRLPAVAPPLLGLAAPVTGAVMGWVVLGQALSPVQLVGFGVTVSAIAYGATLGGPVPVGCRSGSPAVRVPDADGAPPHRVGVEGPALLGDLHLPATGEVAGDVSGQVHDVPPALAADGAGRIRRAGRGARGPVAGQRRDGGRDPLAPVGVGRLVPPRLAPLAQGDLGRVHTRPGGGAVDAYGAPGVHQLGDELGPQRLRDRRVGGPPASSVDDDVPAVGGPLGSVVRHAATRRPGPPSGSAGGRRAASRRRWPRRCC